MKKLFLALALAFTFTASFAQDCTTDVIEKTDSWRQDIPLSKYDPKMKKGTRKMPARLPEAYLTENTLNIDLKSSTRLLEVSIYDQNNNLIFVDVVFYPSSQNKFRLQKDRNFENSTLLLIVDNQQYIGYL